MSYEPKTWECGDVISAEDLNHIEEGIANCGGGGSSEPLILQPVEDDDEMRLDKTFGEIKSAFNSGRPLWIMVLGSGGNSTYLPIKALTVKPQSGGAVETEGGTLNASTDEDYPSADK